MVLKRKKKKNSEFKNQFSVTNIVYNISEQGKFQKKTHKIIGKHV